MAEIAEIERLSARRAELAGRRVELETAVSDLTRDQKKADTDVELVKSRRARDQQRLAAGQVSSPRELEQLEHEVGTLERRISALEDVELEVMEALETAQSSLDQVRRQLAEVEAEARDVESTRDHAVADIDAQAREARAERDRLTSGLPEGLLSVYERVRSQTGGIAAAALRQRRCEGCRLELTAADIAEIAAAPPDEVLRCPECNRILVRTSESGV